MAMGRVGQTRELINVAMEMRTLLFCLFLWISALPVTSVSDNVYPEVDVHFTDFLRQQGYRGGAISAMRDGRLLVARGYGHDRKGNAISAFSKFPISNVAKSFTAVAILNLVEDGKLRLDDTVFGPDGLLDHIQPWRGHEVDHRLGAMTVNHLLHHCGGWDDTKPPLYDPMANAIYLQRGHKVTNIAREMGKATPYDTMLPEELISYVITKPLHFTPGSKEAYSNIGYLVLGRVIEAVSGMEYRDFIKRIILDRCGMWNTRLELSHFTEEDFLQDTRHQRTASVMDVLQPACIDSSLGWYSNVYDLMRFSRCLFHTKSLLDQKYLDLMLTKPAVTQDQIDVTSWYSFGFRVSNTGAVWQDADPQTDDLILYYRKPREINHYNRKLTVHIKLSKENEDQNQQPPQQLEDVPDSWIVLLSDKSVNHLRHQTRQLMTHIKPSRLLNNPRTQNENIFLYDLSELHRHPTWEQPDVSRRQVTVRYKIDEHHLTSYVNALRSEQFGVHSFTSLTHKQHTFFLVVGSREPNSDSRNAHFVFQHGMDHRKLLKTKLRLEQQGYNMTQLHSYNSQSHRSHIHSFAAVFNYGAYTSDTLMKYGTSHLPEPYHKLVQMYHEQNFHPISQTVVFHNKDERFSFIFVKKLGVFHVDFKHYYNLSAKKLRKITEDSAKTNMHLSYLNAYNMNGNSRFCAVFTNATHHDGVLEIDRKSDHATESTILNLQHGRAPKQIVPYFDDHNKMKIAVYFEEL